MRPGDLKTIKEIAAELGRGRTYVHAVKTAMEAAGCAWPANMISTEEFIQWVKVNRFKCSGYVKRSKTWRNFISES